MPKSTLYIREVSLEHNKVVKYRVHYSGEYKGELKTNIHRFKFRKQKDLGCYFGEHIYKNLPKDYDLSNYDYLLPVPSKPSSISERGYNAVRLIGERLSELCGLPLAKDILEALDRLRQTRVSKVKREQHIKGGFRLICPSRVEGKSFLVLDDITTTGSTLDEVIRTLSKAAPRKLDALVLAKKQH